MGSDKEISEGHRALLDLAEFAWGIIANANEGDWEKATPEWQDAAKRWRTQYHDLLPKVSAGPVVVGLWLHGRQRRRTHMADDPMIEEDCPVYCRWCSKVIVSATYAQMGGWEPDYDPGDDPVAWRHSNGYAACLNGNFATPRPTIVVLCGSTRFPEAWAKARYDLTLAGEIVLTIGCDTKSDEGLGITVEQKEALDELHKRKIDLADRVLVLNVGRYIGESTHSEIDYATALGKPIDYLERG
jgi:hypothetical protein